MVTATQTESDASLSHHGIKGMRWGVRRFQNKDGSLKNAGKKRYNVDIEDAVTKANSKLKYANRQVKNEKIKSKLNDETKRVKDV